MTLENFNYRTNPLFLRNQFNSANSFGIPDVPKAKFTDDELRNLLMLGFNQQKKIMEACGTNCSFLFI